MVVCTSPLARLALYHSRGLSAAGLHTTGGGFEAHTAFRPPVHGIMLFGMRPHGVPGPVNACETCCVSLVKRRQQRQWTSFDTLSCFAAELQDTLTSLYQAVWGPVFVNLNRSCSPKVPQSCTSENPLQVTMVNVLDKWSKCCMLKRKSCQHTVFTNLFSARVSAISPCHRMS